MLDVARLLSLIGCILSQYALFHTAFLRPSISLEERIYDSLALLAVAAGISVIGGIMFRSGSHARRNSSLAATLPLQIFCWASGAMLILFVISWYVESHTILYRDIHF